MLHSPYSNMIWKTWRGQEKCLHDRHGRLVIYEEKEDAEEYIKANPDRADNWAVVKIGIVIPNVGEELDAVEKMPEVIG